MSIRNYINGLSLKAPINSNDPFPGVCEEKIPETQNILESMKNAPTFMRKGFAKALGTAALAAAMAVIAVSPVPTFAKAPKKLKPRPNILLIVTDNQFPGTLGCYGNKEISTPNIDRLASQGIKFRNAFACNGLSSPTRASILTGLIPSQHGVHTWLDDNLQSQWPKDWCCIEEFRTLPQTLADAGYDCALIGKYHLGIPDPSKPKIGFNYWVTFPYGHTSSFYNTPIIDNGKTYTYPGHATDFWTEKAVEYISKRKADKPFFMYLTYNGPYCIPPAILEKQKNRFFKLYEGKQIKSSPQLPLNDFLRAAAINYKYNKDENLGLTPWGYVSILNNQEAMRDLCSQVTMVDDGVGRVLDALRQNGLEDNTIVIFTSDQGCCYGQKGIWGQSCITYPSTVYDPQVQVPLIFRHTGRIDPNRDTELVVSIYDLFPTILEYIGLENIKVDNSPGISFAKLLKGVKMEGKDREGIFMEQEQTRAIRTKDWKYIKRFKGLGPEELYDIKNDPDELINLAGDPMYADIKKKLEKLLDDFYKKYANPKFDLWKGGTCKSNSSLAPVWVKVWPGWKPIVEPVLHPFK